MFTKILKFFTRKRKVRNKDFFQSCTVIKQAVIDTCFTDDIKKFETGISHPSFNYGRWVIVQRYNNELEARFGHERWMSLFESWLPNELFDIVKLEKIKRKFITYN